MTQTTDAERKARGEAAARLLENPLVIEAFEVIDAELWRQFKLTDVGDQERLAHIRNLEQAGQNFKAVFLAAVNNGKEAVRVEALMQARDPRQPIRRQA